MKKLNRQVEWGYMQKVLSQAPQYAVFAICVGAIALAAASGAFEEKTPTSVTTISAQLSVIASAATLAAVKGQPPTF